MSAQFNFPPNPSTGQEYQPPDSTHIYIFNGYAWDVKPTSLQGYEELLERVMVLEAQMKNKADLNSDVRFNSVVANGDIRAFS